MAEVGQVISSTLDIEDVYDRFAEEVSKLIPSTELASAHYPKLERSKAPMSRALK